MAATGTGDPDHSRRAALRNLADAAEHAVDLDRIEELSRSGLELARDNDPERVKLLCLLGECLFLKGDHEQARAILEEARAEAESRDDPVAVAEVLSRAFGAEWQVGNLNEVDTRIRDAIAVLEDAPPSGHLARILAHAAFAQIAREDFPAAREYAERALAVATDVRDRVAMGWAREWRGTATCLSGEADGADDLRAAATILAEAGSPLVSLCENQLADSALLWHGAALAEPHCERGIEMAAHSHDAVSRDWLRAERATCLLDLGEWDEVLRIADDVLATERAAGATQTSVFVGWQKARILALRGDVDGGRATITPLLDLARSSGNATLLGSAVAALALIELLDGRPGRARRLLADLGPPARGPFAPIAEICRILIEADGVDHARAIVADIDKAPPRTQHSLVSVRAAFAAGDGRAEEAASGYADAAARWREFGHVVELAKAQEGLADCLETLGDHDGANAARAESQAIAAGLGVRRLV